MSISERVVGTLSGPGGYELCAFLRAFYYEETMAGGVAPARLDETLLDQATELGLVREGRPGRQQLTAVGYAVANFSKEYCNWVDGGRRLPEGVTAELLSGRRVLDVGSSLGRHLVSFARHGARPVGVELQEDYVVLSRVLARREGVTPPTVARGRAETLPFRTAAFDLVLCRLVLQYVLDVHQALSELARVLAPGGVLVLKVEEPRTRLLQLVTGAWRGNFRERAFTVFGLVNTALLQLTGTQWRFSRTGRMHSRHSPSWPSLGWLARQLATRGLRPFEGSSIICPSADGLLRACRPLGRNEGSTRNGRTARREQPA